MCHPFCFPLWRPCVTPFCSSQRGAQEPTKLAKSDAKTELGPHFGGLGVLGGGPWDHFGPRVSRDRFWSGKSANLTPDPGPHFGAFPEKSVHRTDVLAFSMGGAFNMPVLAEFVENTAPGEG